MPEFSSLTELNLHLLLTKLTGFGFLGVNHLVISIPLVTSLFNLLRNSFRGVLAPSSVFGNPLWNTTSTLLSYIGRSNLYDFGSTTTFLPAAVLLCFRCSYDSGDSRSASQTAQLYAPSSSSLSCVSSPLI